ncbi:MAG TPA: glycosyltransferase family 4 protein [Mycobacteriales bacterium]|nr:glycosyltransferase family 4 protein [Mycobacteriales bacterium]
MRILVYPHSMEIGGSQLNAIELAGAVRDRGHEVVVLSEDGDLVEVVHRLGLEHVPIDPRAARRPSPYAVRQLAALARDRRLDVLHGYEWPPGVETFLAAARSPATAVCTVMSMSVAPFLPHTMPLVVGTEDTRAAAVAAGHRSVTLLEPPVDMAANSPDFPAGGFRAEHGLDPDLPLVVVVCRLVRELKLEGLLTACDAVGALAAAGTPVQLAVVGDGAARDQVAEAAAKADAQAGRRVVVLTGQLSDPRPAYAAADVMLGMGGSALRGLAFGKPLVVQGERGFWQLLTPGSEPVFLRQGWYGVGAGDDGAARLAGILRPLLADPGRWAELGRHGRRLVEDRFSLAAAAADQEQVYAAAGPPGGRAGRTVVAADTARMLAGVGRHKVRRKWQRWRGTAATDDFNALAGPVPTGRRDDHRG